MNILKTRDLNTAAPADKKNSQTSHSPGYTQITHDIIPAPNGRSTIARMLMRAATAIGLEAKTLTPSARDSTGEVQIVTDTKQSLFATLKQAILTIPFAGLLISFGRAASKVLSNLLDFLIADNAAQKRSPPTPTIAHLGSANSDSVDFNRSSENQANRSLALKPDTNTGPEKKENVFAKAMQESAEAEQRENERESRHRKRRQQESRSNLEHAKRIIEKIDACGGPNYNNPKVAEILAALGTPYDSIQQAIAQVEALQKEERENPKS